MDLLKAEFPLDTADLDETHWAAACRDLHSASVAPWILLSAAVDFHTYLRQVNTACLAGASGIAVGRAVWKEAVTLQGQPRAAFLRDVALPRLQRLTALCNALARPWGDDYSMPAFTGDWYHHYDAPPGAADA
jgi:tagatose-1,6-bisphosphate aldolase